MSAKKRTYTRLSSSKPGHISFSGFPGTLHSFLLQEKTADNGAKNSDNQVAMTSIMLKMYRLVLSFFIRYHGVSASRGASECKSS